MELAAASVSISVSCTSSLLGVYREIFRRGTVHVISDNPAVLSAGKYVSISISPLVNVVTPPLVNPMYLADDFDVFLSANATKASRGIMATPPISQLIINELSPGFIVVPPNATDAQWQAFVKSNVSATIHPVGSVAMGPKEEGGCVDSNLVVYGTKNVRVVGEFC